MCLSLFCCLASLPCIYISISIYLLSYHKLITFSTRTYVLGDENRLSAQPLHTVAALPSSGKGKLSRLDLTSYSFKHITSIYLPTIVTASSDDKHLYNGSKKQPIDLFRLSPSAGLLPMDDIPEKFMAMVEWSHKRWSKVYRAPAGNGAGKALKFFNKSEAEYHAADSHKDHVMKPNHNNSALKFLRKAQLVDEEIATTFKAIGKHFQRAWRKMVEPEVIDCARGEDCKDRRHRITTSETGSWTVDLPMARDHITKALVQLRDADKLELVSSWMVSVSVFSLSHLLLLD